tara:strand:- start:413 stop:832 length:420 start_codon:yes stop_codon:yes gene_type:complete
MKKFSLFILVAFCISTHAFSAEFNWSKVVQSADSKTTFYIDKKTVFKFGKYIYFWQLSDYIIIDNPEDEKSVITFLKANCDKFEMKWISLAAYEKNMGRGSLLFEFLVPDDQPDEFTWRQYDSKKTNQGYIINKACKLR